MAIIISRTFKGKPIREDELQHVKLNDNVEIDHLLNHVLMRMNQNDAGINIPVRKLNDKSDVYNNYQVLNRTEVAGREQSSLKIHYDKKADVRS